MTQNIQRFYRYSWKMVQVLFSLRIVETLIFLKYVIGKCLQS